MILRMPGYCRDFICSADKCSDNCCIGWEIDIDEKTAEYYMSVEGEFGKRLKNGITSGDCYSFILNNGRCPFLNERNLCDIILNLGEDKLCHICNEHPRYYEWFDGVIEGGVGLCCEEAAKLILTRGGEAGFFEKETDYEKCDEYDSELFDYLCDARERITGILRDGKSLKDDVSEILAFAADVQDCIDNGGILDMPGERKCVSASGKADTSAMLAVFSSLEPIDEKWRPYIDGLEKNAKIIHLSESYEKYIRNIGIYYIWRYFLKGVFDEEILSKVKLAVISMAMLGIMFGSECGADMHRCAVLAKNYSKETEYSEENLESIYDMTYTEQVFSQDSLIAFFE